MSDFVYPTVPALASSGFEAPAGLGVPALASSGFEAPAGLGVPAFAGLALRPVPRSIAAPAARRFGRGAELLDETAAAERLAGRIAATANGLQSRSQALAADLAAARRLVDDARKLARRPDDHAVATIAAHGQLVAGMLERHAVALPSAVDRMRRLAALDPDDSPLVAHARVQAAFASLFRLLDEIAAGQAELRSMAHQLAQQRESAATARAGSVAELQARLAAAEARIEKAGDIAALEQRVVELTHELGRLVVARLPA